MSGSSAWTTDSSWWGCIVSRLHWPRLCCFRMDIRTTCEVGAGCYQVAATTVCGSAQPARSAAQYQQACTEGQHFDPAKPKPEYGGGCSLMGSGSSTA